MKNPNNYDKLYGKWQKTFKIIEEQLKDLLIKQSIYQDILNIASSNSNINGPNIYWTWLLRIYMNDLIIGIRRQLDNRRGKPSIKRLFSDIIKNSAVLSRERYINLHLDLSDKDGSKIESVKRFELNFSKEEQLNIDTAMVQKDLNILLEKGNIIKDFADKRIAHYDEREEPSVISLRDTWDCLDYLEKLFLKYNPLFNKTHVGTLVPGGYPWRKLFKEAWIQDI